MSLKKIKNAPAFDPAEPHGTIYGSGEESDQPPAKFVQGGHYYAANREYVGSDESAANVAATPQPVRVVNQNERTVEPEELAELLKGPRAEDLLKMGLDQLARAVAKEGGPQFGGDSAARHYVAWLLKFAAD